MWGYDAVWLKVTKKPPSCHSETPLPTPRKQNAQRSLGVGLKHSIPDPHHHVRIQTELQALGQTPRRPSTPVESGWWMMEGGQWMPSELCTPVIPTCPSPGQPLTPHPKTQRPRAPVPPAPQLRLLPSLVPAPAGCPFKAPSYPFKFYFFKPHS